MRVIACGLVVVAACGKVDDKPDAPVPDAAPDSVLVDAPPSLGPFGAPLLMQEIATTSIEADPSMTADRLELWFSSTRPGGVGGYDMWVANRATASGVWGAPVLAVGVNDVMNDQHPEISGDGRTLYFTGTRGTSAEVYVAVRATGASPWSTPAVVPELSSIAQEIRFSTSADELVGLLDSDRAGAATGRDLYLTTRTSKTAPWGVPVLIPELTSADYVNGSLSGDGLSIYLSYSGDLYVTKRPNRTSPFATPSPLPELNSLSSESDAWISADERTIIFNSDRSGSQDLYIATR
jgi:Tol biopolymer transport system component